MKYYIPVQGFQNLFLMLDSKTGDFDFVIGKPDPFSRVAAPRIHAGSLSDIRKFFRFVYGKDLKLKNFCFTKVYEVGHEEKNEKKGNTEKKSKSLQSLQFTDRKMLRCAGSLAYV